MAVVEMAAYLPIQRLEQLTEVVAVGVLKVQTLVLRRVKMVDQVS